MKIKSYQLIVFFCLTITLSFPIKVYAENYSSVTHGFEFEIPLNFKTGKYSEEIFRNQIVLVEEYISQSIDMDSIPIGMLPTITINGKSERDLTLIKKSFGRFQEYKIENHNPNQVNAIYKLPGYPGPYGNEALYYIVELKNSKIIEMTAPIYYLDTISNNTQLKKETNYGSIIESIITSIKIINE